MYVREAQCHELDAIYAMGFDVWGDGISYEEYLDQDVLNNPKSC